MDGKVEVRWGNWSTSVVEAASLTENKQGWDVLSKKQTFQIFHSECATSLVSDRSFYLENIASIWKKYLV